MFLCVISLLLKDKSGVCMVDDKIQDNTASPPKQFGNHLQITFKVDFLPEVHKYKKCSCFCKLTVDAV